MHSCFGNNLASLEMTAIHTALLDRLDHIEVGELVFFAQQSVEDAAKHADAAGRLISGMNSTRGLTDKRAGLIVGPIHSAWSGACLRNCGARRILDGFGRDADLPRLSGLRPGGADANSGLSSRL